MLKSACRAASETSRGQVLVIFAGGLLLLLAIAALVIDLGFVFMLRRYEQNVADPAAIAAARHIRPAENKLLMQEAACRYARQNGLFPLATDNTQCTPDKDPNGTVLTVHYPPSAGAGRFAGTRGFVEVVVERPHKTFFGRALGVHSILVSTSAVAAFTNGNSNSNALVALDPRGCVGNAAGRVSGGAQVKIEVAINPATGLPYDGGYVHVNSTCGSAAMQNGICENTTSGALEINGSGSSLTAPHAYVSGICVKANNNSFNSPLTEGAVQIGDPLADLVPPHPSSLPAGRCGPTGPYTSPTGSGASGCNFNSAGTIELEPGTYYGGWRIGNNVKLKLAPGMYIMAGGGVTLQAGGSIESVDAVTGDIAPIMIFSTDNPAASCPSGGAGCQGRLDFTATAALKVRGIASGPYKGILLWQDGNGSQPAERVELGGQATLDIAGTVYAPKAEVKLTGGSSGTGFASIQIIAWRFDITGSSALTMPYDPKGLYQPEQKGLVR